MIDNSIQDYDLNDYCDLSNGNIVNYLDEISQGLNSLNKLNRIFLSVKNSIRYDPFASIQKASETLVMRCGNNLDKSLLLYVLLKSSEFNVNVCFSHVRDKSKVLIDRNDKIIPWFYIKVNYFGKAYIMDCTFDASYMRAAGVRNEGNFEKYLINNYSLNNEKLFEVYDEKCLTINNKKINSVLKGSEEICI